MGNDNRQSERFKELGRVFAEQLCAIPGSLDDISDAGCKIHFPCVLNVDMEDEYELNISISRNFNETPLKLICQPQWTAENNGITQIGFKVLYSPDANRLKELIDLLKKESHGENFDEIEN